MSCSNWWGFTKPTKRTVRMTFRQIGHGHSLQSGLITEEMLDWWLALLRYTDTSRNELDMGRGFFSPIRSFYRQVALTDDFIGKIQTPTYFLWGDRDPFGGIDTATHIVNLMPNAELEFLANAGHAPWLDDHAHAANAIRAFLRPATELR